ncbi:MAG: hypothetical protein RIR00_1472 [Pseudomonadota bacterium]|jgi:lipopolysaccharide export system protein LptC
MKSGSASLFPLSLLLALAGLSFWLQQSTVMPEERQDGKLRHDPDTIVENLMLRRLDAQGQLEYRVLADRLQHFADDETNLLTAPRITHYAPGKPDINARSSTAQVDKSGDVIRMQQNVEIVRAGRDARQPELRITTPELILHPDAGRAHTAAPVEVRQGKTWLTGVGMEIDTKAQTYSLLSQVKGSYRTPKAP